MGERLAVDLELIEKISAPAKRAAAALRGVESDAEKTKKALSFGAETSKLEQQLKKLRADPAGYQKLLALRKQLSSAQLGLGKPNWLDRLGTDISGKITGALGTAAIGGLVVAGFVEGASKAIDIVKAGIKTAFVEGSAYEQLKLAYKLTLGESGAQTALKDINRFSSQSGFDDDEIAKTMLPLFRAGLRGQAARSAYAAAEDLSAASPGSKPEDFAEFLAKIQLKGGITEKMLLGLGLDSKGFKVELAKTLKTDKETAMQRAESGKADPQAILNALYSQIEKRQGGKLGSGGDAFAKTMGAQLHKLEQLPSNYLKTIADSDAWPRMTAQVSKLLEGLDPDGPRGKKIIDALGVAFTKITDLVDKALTPENISAFVDDTILVVETLAKIPGIFAAVIDKVEAVTNAVGPLVNTIGKALGANGELTDFTGNKVTFRDAEKTNYDSSPFGLLAQFQDMASQPTPYKPTPANDNKRPVIVNNKTDVTVHPAKDDVEHTGHKVAQVVSRSTARVLERGAQEGGGG